MNYVCGDNRFKIIERYKNELISATNIESSPDEMAVLDNILFRFWQMGWLKEQEAVVRCRDCKHRPKQPDWETFESGADIEFPEGSKCPCHCSGDEWYSWYPDDEWFCAEGERK